MSKVFEYYSELEEMGIDVRLMHERNLELKKKKEEKKEGDQDDGSK